jgi:CheY-like chemotaxis protein
MRPASRSSQADSTRPETILVVEGEVLVRMAVSEYLRHCGYRVVEARDAGEARAVMEAHGEIDLVFAAADLPEPMNGFALADWIRRHHPAAKVLLAAGVAGTAQKAEELCGERIDKPYSHQLLADRIRRMLGGR